MLRITPDTTQNDIEEAIGYLWANIKAERAYQPVITFQTYIYKEPKTPSNGWMINNEKDYRRTKLDIEAEFDGTQGKIIATENVRPSKEDNNFKVLFKTHTEQKWVDSNEVSLSGKNISTLIEFKDEPTPSEYTFEFIHPYYGLVAVIGEATDEFANKLLWTVPAKNAGLTLREGQLKFDLDFSSFCSKSLLNPESIVKVLCHPSELMPVGKLNSRLKPQTDRLFQACSSNSGEDMLAYGLEEFLYVIENIPRRGKNISSPDVLVMEEQSKRVFITKAWWLKDIITGEPYKWTNPLTEEVVQTPKMFNHIPTDEELALNYEGYSNEGSNFEGEEIDYACETEMTSTEYAESDEDGFNSTTVENLRKKHNKQVEKKNQPVKAKNTSRENKTTKVSAKVPTQAELMKIINHNAPYWATKDRETLENLGATKIKVELMIPPTAKPKTGDIVAKISFEFMKKNYSVPVYYSGNRLLSVRSGSEKSQGAMCRLVSLEAAKAYLTHKNN